MQNYICGSCGNSFEAAPDGAGMIVCAFCGAEMKAKDAEIPLAPGTKIEGYEILRHLGTGGTGDVYLAEQSLMERKVALKLLKKTCMVPDKVKRFFEEARNAAMFDDPHMVSVLDMGTSADGYCYLATRYVEGETLEALLNRERIFDQKRSLEIIIEVASALGNVWSKTKMFHRDIKPGNIMLTVSGEVMVLDMGIAQTYGENSLVNGEVEGSPYYMSPEQARGEKLFWSTDLYSLGVTLYQMLAGVCPYDAPTLGEILEMHNSKPFPALAERAGNIKVDPEMEALLKRMMGKTPAERFSSWDEFLAVAKELYLRMESSAEEEEEVEQVLLPSENALRETIRDLLECCRDFCRRQIWFMTFLAVLLICALCAGLFLYLAGRRNSLFADRCLQEAAEVTQNKNWKAAELEEVLEEFRPVIDRLGVNPSVRRRFRLYQKEAQTRKAREKKEHALLEQLEWQTAQILEQTQKDLEVCRYNPVLGGPGGKTSYYSRVIRQIIAGRNNVSRSDIALPDNVKRKRQLSIRLHKAVNAVYREFRQMCGKPSVEKKSGTSVPVRKKIVSVKKDVSKPSADAVRKMQHRKKVVRRVRKEIPQARQKVLLLKSHQKKLLEEIFALTEDQRNSAGNPLLRKLVPVRNTDAYWRWLMRTLLKQSRSFYGRVYHSGRKFTNKEIRVGDLNRILRIWTIRKDRIYFRNEPIVRTFSQIYSGDWYDFLKRVSVLEKAQKDFEAYLLFTENYFILDEKTMRNAQAKRLLPCVRALRNEIRAKKKRR